MTDLCVIAGSEGSHFVPVDRVHREEELHLQQQHYNKTKNKFLAYVVFKH